MKVTCPHTQSGHKDRDSPARAQRPGEHNGTVPEALSWARALCFQPTCLQGCGQEQDKTQGLG